LYMCMLQKARYQSIGALGIFGFAALAVVVKSKSRLKSLGAFVGICRIYIVDGDCSMYIT
jgi:hypothetical protein